ncbi:hypothetical protein FQA39_LY15201 [Lamprigera yunnana]|nr:hypothetical protein FQA39_LY15201 [Lamprigera yunnana]
MFTLKDDLKFNLIYYLILSCFVAIYVIELSIGHYSNCLVLQLQSYYTLCSILGLLTIIFVNGLAQNGEDVKDLVVWTTQTAVLSEQERTENKLRNTFGWKRYQTLSLLIRYVFLASSCFSLIVQAINSVIDIQDDSKKSDFQLVFYVGLAGLLYYVVLHIVLRNNMQHHNNYSNKIIPTAAEPYPKTNDPIYKIKSISSDILGSIIVIVYSNMEHFVDLSLMPYFDSILTAILGILLLILNFSYAKKCWEILLQKIPDTIDIEHLQSQLLKNFPDVLNIHDLHIWQLTADNFVSTVHITFKNPHVYPKLTRNLLIFFQKFGIDQATIQPEFFKNECTRSNQLPNLTSSCLIECNEDCNTNFCCPKLPQTIVRSRKGRSSLKELVVDCSTISGKSITVYTTQQTFT